MDNSYTLFASLVFDITKGSLIFGSFPLLVPTAATYTH